MIAWLNLFPLGLLLFYVNFTFIRKSDYKVISPVSLPTKVL